MSASRLLDAPSPGTISAGSSGVEVNMAFVPYIGRDEAAALAGLSVKTFAAYVSRGENGVPQPARHVGRTPQWDRREIVTWVAAREQRRRRP